MRKPFKTAIKTLTSYEKLMIARRVIWSMKCMKEDQIKTEPKEEIWKDQMCQLNNADELLMLDEECWFDDRYDQKELTINEIIDIEEEVSDE